MHWVGKEFAGIEEGAEARRHLDTEEGRNREVVGANLDIAVGSDNTSVAWQGLVRLE